MNIAKNTIWTILAGGKATRLGGDDKGLVELNGKKLVEHVHQRLSQQGANIVINANRNLEIYQRYGTVYSDLYENYQGPLSGMQAIMNQIDYQWYGFVSCDCPNLPPDLLEKMYRIINEDITTNGICAFDGNRLHPTISLMSNKVKPYLEAFLRDGNRKLMQFQQQLHFKQADFSNSPNAFINLNTYEELAKFEKMNN